MDVLRVATRGATRVYFKLRVSVRYDGREDMELALMIESCNSSNEIVFR